MIQKTLEKFRSEGIAGVISRIRWKLLKPFGSDIRYNFDPGAGGQIRPASELENLFANKKGNQVHKWHHYLPIYEQYLGEYRGKDFRMLEIGIYRGGSLELWRDYFGDTAKIFGIDINPDCAAFNDQSAQVRIGSQADPKFLESVIAEMGGVDVIIDDGSHDSIHISKSFDILFPLLSDGGIYIVEDLACAYWPAYSGGYRWPWSFMGRAKQMIDDMHHWYHKKGQRVAATKDHLKAMHVYNSMIVFEKGKISTPTESMLPPDPK